MPHELTFVNRLQWGLASVLGGLEAEANWFCWSSRATSTLSRSEVVEPDALRYLNRLSDLLFVIARVLARHENGSEVLWKRV